MSQKPLALAFSTFNVTHCCCVLQLWMNNFSSTAILIYTSASPFTHRIRVVPGEQYCRSRACGSTSLQSEQWHCVANVYNGTHIVALVNGTVDATQSTDHDNPFAYPDPPTFPTGGIYTPPAGSGADLALGANIIHIGR